jgi:hypothetical protein
MAWKAVVVSKSRDSEGKLSVNIAFQDAGVTQTTKTFQFDRGTSVREARAEIRSHGVKEVELRALVDQLDTQLAVGEEINL